MKTIRLARGHRIEVACTIRGRPSYRWATGWSEVSERGTSQPLRLRDWQAIARRDGARIRFAA